MRERATVLSVDGDIATVAIHRTSLCDHCGKCGAAQLNPGQQFEVSVLNPLGAKPGDAVELEMESKNVLLAALMVYGLPLILAVLGYFVGSFLGAVVGASREAFGIAGGIILFLSTFLILYLLNDRLERSGKFTPRIVRVHRC